jgi:ABC-type transport system involved in multi-copper enzyme maturation permease subunit
VSHSFAACALAASPIVGLALGASWLVVLGLALIGFLGIAALVRNRDAQLLGPLFYYDLIRLARRGRIILPRCAYGLLLLVGLFLAYHGRFGNPGPVSPAPGVQIDPRQMARFAEHYFLVVLILQAAAVLVLTPAYLAGAIAEEKEQQTLELLFTTQLRNREIILGKLFARLTHLAGILLTGLPILSLVQFWGGVDPVLLLASFLVTALTLLSIGSLSILCSVTCRRVVTALGSAYTLVIGLSVGCLCVLPVRHVSSPIVFFLELTDQLRMSAPAGGAAAGVSDPLLLAAQMVGEYALYHGVLALLCLAWATSRLRAVLQEHSFPELVLEQELIEAAARAGLPRPTWTALTESSPPPLPPVGDNPLLWKERYHGSRASGGTPTLVGATWGLIALPIGPLVILVFLSLIPFGPRVGDQFSSQVGFLTRGLGAFVLLVMAISVAFRAAGSISREREERTLDGLLCLPIDRLAILKAKWLGSFLRPQLLLYALAAIWIFGLIGRGLDWRAVPLLLYAGAVHLAFFSSQGVWWSLHARGTHWANFLMALILLVLFVGTWAVGLFLPAPSPGGPAEVEWVRNILDVGVNPVRTWWVLAFEPGRLPATLGASAIGLVLYGVAALGFGLAAGWAFAQEPRSDSAPVDREYLDHGRTPA